MMAQALAFTTAGELLVGSLLLYGFRVFERQAGTEAYGSRVVFVGVLSALLQLGLGAALREPHGFASGPYGVVFAMFVPFCLDVPATSRFTFLGLALTDKAFTYALGLQLLLLHGRLSALAGLCGLAAGALVRLDVLGLRRLARAVEEERAEGDDAAEDDDEPEC